MKRILVIEDTDKHIQEAKKFFAGIVGVEVTYLEDLFEIERSAPNRGRALPKYFDNFDGVISDIFFPRCKGSEKWGTSDQPVGVAVMMWCRELGKACILNTAGYHHGSKYQWICSLQRSLGLPEIVDSTADYFGEADSKDWERAWKSLSELL